MDDLRTSRLSLHAIDVAEGERIVGAAPDASDSWADDYPFEGDTVAVRMFLRASAGGDQRPFGYYRIARLSDGLTVGGIGFKGRPEDGTVEVGYGLAPSARGSGYATEALRGVLSIAAAHGVTTVLADTDLDNVASQRTLTNAGFAFVRSDDELNYYRLDLGPVGTDQ